MAKAHIHARSSARRFGGDPGDYMDIHLFLDSSKGAFADNRHRALTHNAWFIHTVVPLVFGHTRQNSAGHTYSTVDVAEQHCVEDFGGYIPSVQDYLAEMEMKPWMNNGLGVPPSQARIVRRKSPVNQRTKEGEGDE